MSDIPPRADDPGALVDEARRHLDIAGFLDPISQSLIARLAGALERAQKDLATACEGITAYTDALEVARAEAARMRRVVDVAKHLAANPTRAGVTALAAAVGAYRLAEGE